MRSLAKPTYETLKQLYEAERLTTREIAKQLGFASKTSIQNLLREYGIERRPTNNGLLYRGIQEPTRDELYDLIHVQHLTYREIAALYAVDFTAVPYWLRKHNIPRLSSRDSYYKGNLPVLPTKEELEAMYSQGMSLDTIAEMHGVTEIVIVGLFKKFGLQAKPPGFDGGKRYTCKDGHLVRSLYEQRVDDWLFEHNIPHSYEPSLPCDKRYRADFLANGWYIEVWGVSKNKRYAQRRKLKTQLYQDHSLPLIELEIHYFDQKRNFLWIRRLKKVQEIAPVSYSLFADIPVNSTLQL